ncbi:MAG: TldD/PmbA family protein [Clostridia bacterium]|nr:TldD/PmbA family protein [Clostridia bacterium]
MSELSRKGREQPAPFSTYLESVADGVSQLIRLLSEHYDYVSVLSTDSAGFRAVISQKQKSLSSETMTTERGHVVRVCSSGLYAEVAFNDFDPSGVQTLAAWIKEQLDRQLSVLKACQIRPYVTELLEDAPLQLVSEMPTGQLPETADLSQLIDKMVSLTDLAMEKGKDMLDCQVQAQSTHISKMFQTEHRDLRQSYVYSEGNLTVVVSRDGNTQMAYKGLADRKGPEIFEGFPDLLDETLSISQDLLRAEKVVPGEYDIITTPEVSGLIAHEAFGHGVEMDMFVKGRALGAEYIDKRVGSDLVSMHEGANTVVNVASYAFDDEGTLASDVLEIDRGILRNGICDALSAKRLGVAPTGNGKRENYAHKVYTRMTNTIFDSGDSTLEEMIASISHGYLLSGMHSGMEDPKHWGIQCIIERGYEIQDGRLTGKVISPVIMTGYVPDLLQSISMVSRDREVFGTGGCGKGHKEWVKVSDGGPCLKARAKLG